MKVFRIVWLRVPCAIAACLLTCVTAAMAASAPSTEVDAQTQTTSTSAPSQADADTDAGWHVTVSPYLWFPGMSGTVGAKGHEASVHVSPADLLTNFNFGLMG